MIKKQETYGANLGRLCHPQDFKNVKENGVKWVTPAFVIQITETQTPPLSRVGFIVTKKIGHAVTRNRAKRRLRAMIRGAHKENTLFSKDTPHDIVLIARPDSLTRDMTQLIKDLRWSLRRLAEK